MPVPAALPVKPGIRLPGVRLIALLPLLALLLTSVLVVRTIFPKIFSVDEASNLWRQVRRFVAGFRAVSPEIRLWLVVLLGLSFLQRQRDVPFFIVVPALPVLVVLLVPLWELLAAREPFTVQQYLRRLAKEVRSGPLLALALFTLLFPLLMTWLLTRGL